MSFGNPDLITHIQCKTNIIIMIRGREKIPRLGSMTVIFPKKTVLVGQHVICELDRGSALVEVSYIICSC